MSDSDLDRAIALAKRAHKGRTDRQGSPYIKHAKRVMQDVSGSDEKIVAILHDVSEWGTGSLRQLHDSGFSDEVVAAVDALTDRKGESTKEHAKRILADRIALRVKISDLRDNTRPERLGRLPSRTAERLMHKYRKMAKRLGTSVGDIRSRKPERIWRDLVGKKR